MPDLSTLDLTPDQAKALEAVEVALEEGRREFILWYGGIRAGKSTGAAYCLLRHSLEYEHELYLVAHYTARQAITNLAPIFERGAAALGLPYSLKQGTANPRMEIGTNTFAIYGGADAGRDRAIQGMTVAGLLLDEFPLLHPDFVAQAEGRVSVPGGLRVYTGNKTSPYHWTTLRYYNRLLRGDIRGVLLDSHTTTNQHLAADFIAERHLEYDELTRTRFMDNEFALELQPLYSPQVVEDFAGEVAFAVLLSQGNQVLELPIKRNARGVYRAEPPAWHKQPLDCTHLSVGTGTVLCDAASPLLARRLRERGHTVRGYTVATTPQRLERCIDLLAAGTVCVSPEATRLLQELDEYSVIGHPTGPTVPALEVALDYIRRLEGSYGNRALTS